MMSVVKQKEGNRMYPWVSHTWNPIAGCEHLCSYCYMHRVSKRVGKDMLQVKFRESYLKDNLGSGRTIFVGSSGDMWGEWVSGNWIGDVLRHCKVYPDNTYLFQTKNPGRFLGLLYALPEKHILGTTLETDNETLITRVSHGRTPFIHERLHAINMVPVGVDTMISVEPVMKFSRVFAGKLLRISPKFVSIGADTGNNDLSEPSADELRELIYALQEHTEVKLKPNLSRLIDLREFGGE